MVIQKFNKLIRNKWIWGVFAVAISAFFAFDFLIADLNGHGDVVRGTAEHIHACLGDADVLSVCQADRLRVGSVVVLSEVTLCEQLRSIDRAV